MKIKGKITHNAYSEIRNQQLDEFGFEDTEGVAMELEDTTPRTRKEVIIRKKRKHASKSKADDRNTVQKHEDNEEGWSRVQV